MALHIFLSFFYFQISDNLRIYFTYLIVMSIAIIYPAKIALAYAVIEDLVAFFIYPTGPFFLGYTLTALSGMALYCIFLNKKVSLTRIILAKTSVNIISNILLNSLWSAMLYSKGFIYYMTTSTVKNLTLLPFEIILFVIFYQMVYPLFVKSGLIEKGEKTLNIKLNNK